jgi:hypothetical protein
VRLARRGRSTRRPATRPVVRSPAPRRSASCRCAGTSRWCAPTASEAIDVRRTPLLAGEAVFVHGYGATSASGAERGELRSGRLIVDAIAGERLRARAAPANACGGDSGGPLLDEGGALVGVVSSGDLGCASFTEATLVSAHLDLLASDEPSAPVGGGCRASPASRSAPWMALPFASLLVLARRRRAPLRFPSLHRTAGRPDRLFPPEKRP